MNYSKIFLYSILFLSPFASNGQKVSTPSEIFKILEKSKISYEIGVLDESIPPVDQTKNVNHPTSFRLFNEGKMLTMKYEFTDSTQAILNQAEAEFSHKNYAKSRKYYINLLDAYPNFHLAKTYIGQTFEVEKQLDSAIVWYKKSIESNYIDYLAHWFLADAYFIQGFNEKAIDEITIALILNRNHSSIRSAANTIYRTKKKKLSDWVFTPQIQIDSTKSNTIKVQSDDVWMSYALTKATWLYEPGYAESKGSSRSNYTSFQEKDCLAGMLILLDKKVYKKKEELNILKKSLEKGMLDEYILFEIFLRKHPSVAYQLPEEIFDSIKEYIFKMRLVKK